MIQLTESAKSAAKKITVEPNLIFRIVKYDKIFGSAEISEYIRIGDPDLYIGDYPGWDSWVIGGVRAIQNQSNYISYNAGGGTSTNIVQKLAPDRKEGTTITSMVVTLIDKNEEISQLISPGFQLDDVLGADVQVWMGFKGTGYPEDYEIIFRGIINDIDSGPGYVNFLLSSVEDKKRRALVIEATTEITANIPLGPLASVSVLDASIFSTAINGPSGTPDTSISRTFIIDEEVFSYTGILGNTLTGITRGLYGTVEATHASGDEIRRGFRLQGNGIDLALKIMLSGWGGNFVEDVDVKHLNMISPTQQRQNSVFFHRTNVFKEFGITAGDYISVSGATIPANNFTNKEIIDVQVTDDGSFVTVDGVSLNDELDSPGTASFRSKYDTLGIGLRMTPAEVDVTQHEYLRNYFLSGYTFDFRDLFDVSVAKNLIDDEIYTSMACFSIPRQGRSSVTYSIGPIGGQIPQTLNLNNVLNTNGLRLKRSLASNFTNVVKYAYDHDVVNDEFVRARSFRSQTSLNRIPVLDKVLAINSKGLRSGGGEALIENSADRLLSRYQFGAEHIVGVKVLFGLGYTLEIGDVILVDYGSLKLTDYDTGDRAGGLKYMEVINKSLNIKTADVSIDLVNTSFGLGDRFATVAPGSIIDSGSVNNKLFLKKSYGTGEFEQETYKWVDYIGEKILVHSEDWAVEYETTLLAVDTINVAILIDPALPFVPLDGYIVDAPFYPLSSDTSENINWKTPHAFLSATVPIVSAVSQTRFTVSPSDFARIFVDSLIRINDINYTQESPEAYVTVKHIATFEIEIDTPTGFTINNTHYAKLLAFADGGQSYRLI